MSNKVILIFVLTSSHILGATGAGPAEDHARDRAQADGHGRLLQHQQRGGDIPLPGPAQPYHSRVDTREFISFISRCFQVLQVLASLAVQFQLWRKYNEINCHTPQKHMRKYMYYDSNHI